MLTIMIPTQNQESKTAKQQDHKLLCEDQYLQNHEQTDSKSNGTEVIEGSPKEKGDDWVITVTDKLEQARKDNKRTSTNNLCIYRVPHYLYEKDKKSYFPLTVSIGPYHYGKEHLEAMECHKWRAVDMVLQRENQGIEMYIDAMKEIEEEARACYEGPISLSSNKFIEMLLLDGCFVLEFLLGAFQGFSDIGYAHNDPVFAIRGLMHSIRRDMLMLENQLPFAVLCRLMELQKYERRFTVNVELMRLAARFFDPLMPTSQSFINTRQSRDEEEYESSSSHSGVTEINELHLLNIFRRTLLVRKSNSSENRSQRGDSPLVADKRRQRMTPCVTELRDAGFKFRKKKIDHFWDIQFSEGYLEIPRLLIHDGTKSLFLNLIAFEQSHNYSSNDITSYIIFMNNLISSAEDVHYLRRRGIIEHSLGSDSEVADMFNGLCHEVVFNTKDTYLSQLLKDVNRCYKQKYFRKWNAWMRTLKHKYFDTPWAYLSFLAAVLLLFLTFSQSYFAAYSHFKSGS